MRAPALVLLALALPLRAEDSHRAPAPSLSEKSRGVDGERQNTLSEMWQRRLLPLDRDRWGPEETALLSRLRNAEAAGAVAFLRDRLHALKGLAVSYRPAGSSATRLRLTKEGFERYLFLRSQEAIKHFEEKGVDAKWVFSLKDTDGRRLFEDNGLLTGAGEALYARALTGLETYWRAPSGEVFGNRRRPPSSGVRDKQP